MSMDDTDADVGEGAAPTDSRGATGAPNKPAPNAGQDTEAGDDRDLLYDDADDAGNEPLVEGGEESESEDAAPPWKRPAGLEGEELAEWREKMGLPASADDYQISLPEGTQLTDHGQQLVTDWHSFAHEHDLPAEVSSKAVSWLHQRGEVARAKLKEADANDLETVRETLIESWGGEYDANRKLAQSALKALPANLAKTLKAARVGDLGPRLINNPKFIELLAEVGRLRSAKGPAPSPMERLKEIERILNTDVNRYYAQGLDKEHERRPRCEDGG